MREHTSISPKAQTIPEAASAEVMPAQVPIEQDKFTEGLRHVSIQPKLTVGAPDNPYEKEADTVANKVMRMHEQNFVQRKNTECGKEKVQPKAEEDEEVQFKRESNNFMQRKCAACEKEDQEQAGAKALISAVTPFIQTKRDNEGIASEAVSNLILSTKGYGSALPESTRGFMEDRFGADFSDVNIHNGSYAVQMSKYLHAQAFTVGKDIYFNEGRYDPHSDNGKTLLAHELTHTIQQTGSESIQPFSTSDCDGSNLTVNTAHLLAITMLGSAVIRSSAGAASLGPDIIAAANTHFKVTIPITTLRDARLWLAVLDGLSSTLRGANSATYECEDTQSKWNGGCGSGIFAVSLSNIHLCPRWFLLSTVEEKASVLIHEWCHKYGNSINRVFEDYCGTHDYDQQSAEQRIQMPDAYMSYVFQLQRGAMLPASIC